jgi:hypothetical protein
MVDIFIKCTSGRRKRGRSRTPTPPPHHPTPPHPWRRRPWHAYIIFLSMTWVGFLQNASNPSDSTRTCYITRNFNHLWLFHQWSPPCTPSNRKMYILWMMVYKIGIVNLLRINRFFMQDEKKKCKSQIAFPIHSSCSYQHFKLLQGGPKKSLASHHPLEALQWPVVDLCGNVAISRQSKMSHFPLHSQ